VEYLRVDECVATKNMTSEGRRPNMGKVLERATPKSKAEVSLGAIRARLYGRGTDVLASQNCDSGALWELKGASLAPLPSDAVPGTCSLSIVEIDFDLRGEVPVLALEW
jgi:hypothetical protein